MMSTIEVPNDDGKNFGGVESKLNVTKGKQPVKVSNKFILISFYADIMVTFYNT